LKIEQREIILIAGKKMTIGNKLLDTIERNSKDLGMKWARGMIQSEYTIIYKKFSEEELNRRGKDDFDNLVRSVGEAIDMKEIGKTYVKVGRARYQEKFSLSELLFAIHYSKKILWEHVISSGFFSDTLGLYQAMNMMMKIDNFYDLACIYLIRGYSEALFMKLARENRIDNLNIKELFPEGSFFGDEEAKDKFSGNWLSGWNLFKIK
jgi:hypothetical protein